MLRDRNIVAALAFPLSGRGVGNIVFPITGLNNHGDFHAAADIIRVERGPEEIALAFPAVIGISQKCPGAVFLLQEAVVQLLKLLLKRGDVA